MLETTSFFIHACRFLYSAASGYFFLSGLLALLYYFWFRERFALRHLALCFCLLLYSLASLTYTFGPPSPEWNHLIVSAIFVLSPVLFIIYSEMVAHTLRVKPKWLPPLLLPVKALAVALFIDLILYFSFGFSLFISDHQDLNIQNWYMKLVFANVSLEPTIFLVFIPAALCLLAIHFLFLFSYREKLLHEWLLRQGLVATLVSQAHDISLMAFDPPSLFPLAFAGFLLEVIRFNISLVRNYSQHQDRLSLRLKESLINFAQVRLSKQVLHDVNAIRRNLLFTLDQSPQIPTELHQSLKREIDRLKIYKNSDIKTPQEKLFLQEICSTTLSLFDKELRKMGFEVTCDIDPQIFVFCSRNDLFIVLINLIQNSIEALIQEKHPKLTLEAEDLEDRVLLKISDSGKISIDETFEIFKPGYSSKSTSRGLGLSIVQESLAANSALISLDEKSNHTLFKIEFLKLS